jgi:hypothetical protein
MKDKLTPKQDKFVANYIEIGNGTESVIQAGYNVKDRKVAGVISTENLNKPKVKNAIEKKKQEVLSVIEDESMNLVQCLLSLAKNKDTPGHVKIKAIIDLLDRAGIASNQTKHIDVDMQVTQQSQDLARRARDLLASSVDISSEK